MVGMPMGSLKSMSGRGVVRNWTPSALARSYGLDRSQIAYRAVSGTELDPEQWLRGEQELNDPIEELAYRQMVVNCEGQLNYGRAGVEARHQLRLFKRTARQYIRNRGIFGLSTVIRGSCAFDILGLFSCGVKERGIVVGGVVASLTLGLGIGAMGTLATPIVLLGAIGMLMFGRCVTSPA